MRQYAKRCSDDYGAIDALIADFDGASWQVIMEHRTQAEVTLSMPRFKIENELVGLEHVLAAMGMPLSFSSDSDFSAMSDMKAYFSQVIQKSYVSVDEKGTEASAVTTIKGEMDPGPMPNPTKVTMVLDRPFFFAITEQSTGAILFMGKVTAM